MTTPRAPHKAPRPPAAAARHRLGLLAVCLLALVAPAARADGDPAQFLEKLRNRRESQTREDAREFDRLIHQGRLLLEQRAYDQARALLARAHAIRPDDDTCRRLLAQIDVATATPARSQSLLKALRDDRTSRERTQLRLLEHDLFNAQQALKAGKPDLARDHAQRVLTGAQYLGDAARAADLRTKAQAVADTAAKARDDARAHRQQHDLAASRRRAAHDHDQHLSALCKRGWQLHQDGKLDQAVAIADEMLKLDPGNRKAVFLRLQTQQAIDRLHDPKALRAERDARTVENLVQQVEREMTVPEDIAAKVVLRGKKDFGGPVGLPLARPMETWEQRIRAKLAEPVTVEFTRATVPEACHHLSQLVDCPIMVDPSASREGSQFSLPRMTVSFEHVLRWLCRFNKLTYTVRDHAILVTIRGGGRLNRPVTRDYDVSGLLVPTRAIKTTFDGGIQVDGHTLKPIMEPKLAAAQSREPRFAKDVVGEGWVDFIRSTVEPDTWGRPAKGAVLQEGPRYTIQYRNGRVVVVHTPEVQREIEQLLNNFRRARNLQVHMLARFLQVEMDFLVNMDLDIGTGADPDNPDGFAIDPNTGSLDDTHRWEVFGEIINDDEVASIEEGLNATGGLSLAYTFLKDEDSVNAFLQAVVKHRKGTLLIAPRLTCFNTQRANFQAVTNFNYVRTVSSDNEPEIGNIPDGIVFDIQPFVSADHRYITLILQPQLRTLISLVTFQYIGGGVEEAFISIPTVELKSIATTVTVPDGGTVICGGLARADEVSGMSSVPFVAHIPLLRYIFREWSEAERRTSLLILVTAQIVPDIFED